MASSILGSASVVIGAVTKPLDIALNRVKSQLSVLASKPTVVSVAMHTAAAQMMSGIQEVFQSISSSMGGIVPVIVGTIASLVDPLTRVIGVLATGIKEVISIAFTTIKLTILDIAKGTMSLIGGVLGTFGDVIKDVFGGIYNALKAIFAGLTSLISSVIGPAIRTVFDILMSFPKLITMVFMDLAKGVMSAAKTIIGTLGNVIANVAGGVAAIIGSVASTIMESTALIAGATGRAALGLFATITTASFAAAKGADALAMAMHRNREIFGQMFPMVERTIKGLAGAFGYTRTELANMSADLGLMFVGMGLNTEATSRLSAAFLKLGVDAAGIYGMDLPEFMNRLQGGIAGANRGLHHMGIFIDETKVQWERWRLASLGIVGVTEEQSIQLARTSLIMAGLSKAAGQANWAHQQFGGTLREVKGRITEMWAAFGEAVKPAWTLVLTRINEILKDMGLWLERNKAIIADWAYTIANDLVWLSKHWKELLNAVQATMINLGTVFRKGFNAIFTDGILGSIGKFFADKFSVVGGIMVAPFIYMYNVVTTVITNLKNFVLDTFTMVWEGIKSGFFKLVSELASPFAMVEDFLVRLANAFIDNFNEMLIVLRDVAVPLVDLAVLFGKMTKEQAAAFKLSSKPLGHVENKHVMGGFANDMAKRAAIAQDKAAGAALTMKGPLAGLPGFPAQKIATDFAELMKLPEFQIGGKFAKIGEELRKAFKPLLDMLAKVPGIKKAPAEKKEPLGPGMQAPIIPGRRLEGGFVGITEFAKQIQMGAFSQETQAAAIARNTAIMAQWMQILGPQVNQWKGRVRLAPAGFA